MFCCKIKNRRLRISIYIFLSILLFLIISWFLTATLGIKAVKKEHEAFLKYHYEHCKKAYKKDPTIALTWTTPQMGVSPRRASFWRKKLFKEKRYPSFEEWRKFHKKRNIISYSAFCPFLIESKHSNWLKEYFWFFGYTRMYKYDILKYID